VTPGGLWWARPLPSKLTSTSLGPRGREWHNCTVKTSRELWEQKLRGFDEYEVFRHSLPPDRLSFEEAMNWNDSVLALSEASGKPLSSEPLEQKLERVARLRRFLAVLPR